MFKCPQSGGIISVVSFIRFKFKLQKTIQGELKLVFITGSLISQSHLKIPEYAKTIVCPKVTFILKAIKALKV